MRSVLSAVAVLAALWPSPVPAVAQTAPYRVAPGKGSFQARKFMPVGPRLGFESSLGGGGAALTVSDGTDAGTAVLVSPLDLTDTEWGRIGNMTVFVGSTAATGGELWRTDGTAAGTALIQEIVPGYDASRDVYRSPTFGFSTSFGAGQQEVAEGEALYFLGSALDTGRELWKTDGTAAGTVLVKDFTPGTTGGYANSSGLPNGVNPSFARIRSTRNRAVFVGPDRGLWATDGTEAGTVKLGAFAPYLSGNMVELGGKVYLGGKSSGSAATVGLIETDGTPAGTRMVSEGAFSFPGLMQRSGDRFFFVANDVAATETALWLSDGTAAGTRRLAQLHTGTSYAYSSLPAVAPDGRLFLPLRRALWTSDGTAAGTLLLKTFAGSGSFDPTGTIAPLAVGGSRAYFNVYGTGLYASNGTVTGTVPVPTSTGGPFTAGALRQVGSTFYLGLSTSFTDAALWAIGNVSTAARPSDPAIAHDVSVQARGLGRVAVTAPLGAPLHVEVFDLLGRRVALLHDGPSVGAQTLGLPQDLPAGMYVVRARAGESTATLTVVQSR